MAKRDAKRRPAARARGRKPVRSHGARAAGATAVKPAPAVRAPAEPAQAPQAPSVHWDDSGMKTSYANVCNLSSTREEIVALFGVNQAWNSGDVKIALLHRVVFSPATAKRLAGLLGDVVKKYEAQFGALGLEGPN